MMTRYFTPNRWNWSQKAEKWVYIELSGNGKRSYHYQIDPPQEFIDLTMHIKGLNEKLLITTDPKENMKIFKELMKVSKRMQEMGMA